jgi:hypothetical protein
MSGYGVSAGIGIVYPRRHPNIFFFPPIWAEVVDWGLHGFRNLRKLYI